MAIKGFSDEIVEAMRFNPMDDVGEERDTGEQTGEQNRPVDSRRDPETGQFKKASDRLDPQKPQKNPSEERFNQREKGRNDSPAGDRPAQKPAQKSASSPGEGEEQKNSIKAFMEGLQKSPAAMFMPQAPLPQMPVPQPAQQQAPVAQPTQQPAQQQQSQGYDYTKPFARRDIQLPPQLLQAIFHEDQNIAAQGMNVLVNTIYNSLAEDMHNRMVHMVQTLPPQILQQAGQHSALASAQQQFVGKFFGKFPALKTPAGAAAAQALGTNIARMYEASGQQVDPMSDEYIDYLGEQVTSMLVATGQLQQPQNAEPRRQFQTNGGARQGSSGGGFMEALGM